VGGGGYLANHPEKTKLFFGDKNNGTEQEEEPWRGGRIGVMAAVAVFVGGGGVVVGIVVVSVDIVVILIMIAIIVIFSTICIIAIMHPETTNPNPEVPHPPRIISSFNP